MSVYAPGPWRVARDLTGTRIFSTRWPVAIVLHWPFSPRTVKANARLIAAAPKTLKMLKEVRSQLGWRGRGSRDLDWFYCEFCDASSEDSHLVPHLDTCFIKAIDEAIAEAEAA